MTFPVPSHFLIGIPGSGKSTFAQWLQQQTQGKIISPDQIRAKLYGDPTIQGSWTEIETVVFEEIKQAIANYQAIIYDATNVRRQWRQDFLQHCPPLTWVAWHLDIPFAICQQRNQGRSRQVPAEILSAMAIDLAQEPPQREEGFLDMIPLPDTAPQTLMALKKQHPQYLGD